MCDQALPCIGWPPCHARTIRRPGATTSSTTCTGTTSPTRTAGWRTPRARRRRRGRRRRTRWSGPRSMRCRARPAARRLAALLGPASSAPRRGAASGSSSCAAAATRSTRCCSTVDPDGTERVLVDPIAIDPAGATTLDAWQPSQGGRPAGLPALRGRHRGVRAARAGRRHRRASSTGRSTARATPPSPGCPAARPSTTCAGWRPRPCPTTRRSTTAGCGCTASAPTPTEDVAGLRRRAWTRPTTTACSVSMDGRWLSVSASAGHGAAQRRVAGRPAATRRSAPAPARRPGRASTRDALHVGRDGRAYVFTDRDAPRGRLASSTRRRPGVRALDRPRARGPRGRARGLRDPRRPRARRRPVLLASWTRHAVSEVTRPRPAHRRPARRRSRCPASAPSPGSRERPEGGHEAWFGYTDHTTPSQRLPLRRAHRRDLAVGDGAGHRRRARRCTTRQVDVPVAGRHTVRMLVIAPRKRAGPSRGRRSSTATAASASR